MEFIHDQYLGEWYNDAYVVAAPEFDFDQATSADCDDFWFTWNME